MTITPIKLTLPSCLRGETEKRGPFDGEVRGVDDRTREAAKAALGDHWKGVPLQGTDGTDQRSDCQKEEKINKG